MKLFLSKVTLFGLFFVVIQLVPSSFIYYRFWEKESLYTPNSVKLPLPVFFPNLDYTSLDRGDLTGNPTCSKPKSIHWFTDKYGLRKKISIRQADFVIEGCSNSMGCNVDYKNTFSAIIQDELKCKIYNCTPDYTLDYLQYISEKEHPEKIQTIYLVLVERYFCLFESFNDREIDFIKYPTAYKLYLRLQYNHAGRRIKNSIIPARVDTCRLRTHFLGTMPDTAFINDNIAQLKRRIGYYENKGIQVKVIVIPEKEIFSDDKKVISQNIRCFQLVNECLAKYKIKNINILEKYVQSGGLDNYSHSDSHINESGHKIIAGVIVKDIRDSDWRDTIFPVSISANR